MILHLDDILHPLRVLGKVGSGAYSVAVTFASADPTFFFLSCIDNITIESRKNGAIIREQYGNLNRVSVSVQADANTPVKIIGDVTEIYVAGDVVTDIDVTNCESLVMLGAQGSTFAHIDLTQNEHLQYLDLLYNSALEELDVTANPELAGLLLSNNSNISTLDLSQNPALQTLGLNTMPNITDLDLSANTALDELVLIDCTGITTLDLSANPALTSFNGSGSVNIDTIYVYSDNAIVATGIANLITNATANDGTVYTNTAGAYFSIIKTAALAKGWTIRQLGSWLTDTTQQAILTAFGDTDGAAVIAATNDYLNTMAENDLDKAISMASYIAEDPMLVCSLGLQPEGMTMPIRGLAGDGQAYIATGLYYANGGHTEININGSFAKAGVNGCALFGNLQTNNGNWYGINQSGQFYFRCINVSTTGADCTMDKFYKYQGVFDSKCTLKVTDITGTTIENLSLTRPSNNMGSNSIFLFSQNFDGSAFRTSEFRMSFAEIIQGNVHREMYCFVRKTNGVEEYGMLDVLGDKFYKKAGNGAFSIDYRLPDGTPWTPGT